LVCRSHAIDFDYIDATDDEVGAAIAHNLFVASDNKPGVGLIDGVDGHLVTNGNVKNASSNFIGFNYEYPLGDSTFPDITNKTTAELNELLVGNSSYIKSGVSTVKLRKLIIHNTRYETLSALMENINTAVINLVGTPDGRLINLATSTQPVFSEQLSADAFTV